MEKRKLNFQLTFLLLLPWWLPISSLLSGNQALEKRSVHGHCVLYMYLSCPLAWIYLLVFSALDSSHILFCRQLNSLAGDKMKIRPKRHHKTATNPIKNLQQRTDVRTDTEVHFTVLFILKLCLGISVH